MSIAYDPLGGRTGPFNLTLPNTVSPGGILGGSGSPEGVVPGSPGQRYRDNDNNDLYLKMGGTQEIGWRLIGSLLEGLMVSATGITQVFYGNAVDPNGVITARAPAIYYSLTDGSDWRKTNTGSDNVGWEKQSA
jgi:hypothetical protein